MIHQPFSPDRVHPQISSSEIVSPLPCSYEFVRHELLFVIFFKKLISFIGFLVKCHTRVFSTLIFSGCSCTYSLCTQRETIVDCFKKCMENINCTSLYWFLLETFPFVDKCIFDGVENIMGKGEMLVTSIISLAHSVFKSLTSSYKVI